MSLPLCKFLKVWLCFTVHCTCTATVHVSKHNLNAIIFLNLILYKDNLFHIAIGQCRFELCGINLEQKHLLFLLLRIHQLVMTITIMMQILHQGQHGMMKTGQLLSQYMGYREGPISCVAVKTIVCG